MSRFYANTLELEARVHLILDFLQKELGGMFEFAAFLPMSVITQKKAMNEKVLM